MNLERRRRPGLAFPSLGAALAGPQISFHTLASDSPYTDSSHSHE